MDPIVTQTKNNMQRAFDVLRTDFATVRTGKASPALVENAIISAYGGSAQMRLLELATIHAQDAQTLMITPFDASIKGEIVKGIQDANLGLSPILTDNIIRISLPPLTEERRKEFVKLIHQKSESGRIMIRQVRHEAMEDIKKMGDTISEDEVRRLEKEIQKLTDDFMEKIDDAKKEKEEELMRM